MINVFYDIIKENTENVKCRPYQYKKTTELKMFSVITDKFKT